MRSGGLCGLEGTTKRHRHLSGGVIQRSWFGITPHNTDVFLATWLETPTEGGRHVYQVFQIFVTR